MLKITVQAKEKITKLVLEGRLGGPWVEELDRCSREFRKDQHNALIVDLTDVSFIDPAGEGLLARLWRNGVTLYSTGCLTNSIIDEIIGAGRANSFRSRRKRKENSNNAK